MKHTNSPPFSSMIEGLIESPDVVVDDTSYTASCLAMMIAIREDPMIELERTPQLCFELGRISARANAILEEALATYRTWRDDLLYTLQNDIGVAIDAGFKCATDPGKDAKGKLRSPKCPSKSSIEEFYRRTNEYEIHHEATRCAQDAADTIGAAYQAAKQRSYVLRVLVTRENAENTINYIDLS